MLVSLCLLKIEIDLNDMNDEDNVKSEGAANVPANSRVIREHRGQRKPKSIRIDNYACSEMEQSSENRGILPSGSRETTPMASESDNQMSSASPDHMDDKKAFFSGNPFVEVTKGIIHMYKKNERIEMHKGLSKTLCLFSVPATLNCHDILNFVAPCHPVLQHIRIIRDGTPNQFMVLLEFRSVESAMEFYETYNGTAYNNLEPDSLCHAVWVSNVEWGDDGLPPLGHTELPTCPVCLERMDESVDGVLTILCNHAFHANCLIKWGDSTCPVCRCVQTPELAESSVCMECEGTEALWICLICGHVGCGRYQGGHAASHFRTTNHTYALQLGSNRVWDYAGDNFVHRLLQSKSDGKLVATEDRSGNGDEKIDSMQLEFTYMLTSQLEAQRRFYEDRLIRLENVIEKDNKSFKEKMDDLLEKFSAVEAKLQTVTKEKVQIEKKYAHVNAKITTLIKDLAEERQMNKALQSNQASWQSKYTQLETNYRKLQIEKEGEITELKDEIRDLMFYMEAQNTISNSDLKDEIATSSISVPNPPSQDVHQKQRRKKK